MIESKIQVAMTILSFIIVSCHVGSAKTTLMHVGHYGRKNFTQFGSFEEILQMFSWVHLFFLFSFSFPFLIESKRQIAITRLSFIVILCHVGSTKTTLMHMGHYGGKKLYTFWLFRKNSIDLFLGPSFFILFFGKRNDNINVCGSLWQKKLYTFWQFQRNSINLFLGPSFFFTFLL